MEGGKDSRVEERQGLKICRLERARKEGMGEEEGRVGRWRWTREGTKERRSSTDFHFSAQRET